ncbi:hypothetical protein BN1012_Phect2371 [Candidatus Phaeomarinobacter ectocarpi]|uniref:Uncharacterized protein n=1 Tax=Candidatus Phaeomarinibacter ectocarpi TaxID=1458461 RepID=X5MGH7_9HYPH|nr:hypothetical protein BN1012_Phect2371 [Candidatus Phaeomarinobacter ectocarpi]
MDMRLVAMARTVHVDPHFIQDEIVGVEIEIHRNGALDTCGANDLTDGRKSFVEVQL